MIDVKILFGKNMRRSNSIRISIKNTIINTMPIFEDIYFWNFQVINVNTMNNTTVIMRAIKIASGAYVKNIIANIILPKNITSSEITCFRITNFFGNIIVRKYRPTYVTNSTITNAIYAYMLKSAVNI
jgi:hypothetical protein